MEDQDIDDLGSFPFASSWVLYVRRPLASPIAGFAIVYPEDYKSSTQGEMETGSETNTVQQDHNKSSGSKLERITLLLTEVDGIKSFWQAYHSLPRPSHLKPDTDYFLFRAGISPFAEDICNDCGGRWTVQLPSNKTDTKIDVFWMNLIMHAVGEASSSVALPGTICADLATLINGVSIAVRQNFFLLSIWIKPQPEEFFQSPNGIEIIKRLGYALKTDVLGYPVDHQLTKGNPGYTTEVEFQRHIRGKSKKALRKTRIIVGEKVGSRS